MGFIVLLLSICNGHLTIGIGNVSAAWHCCVRQPNSMLFIFISAGRPPTLEWPLKKSLNAAVDAREATGRLSGAVGKQQSKNTLPSADNF
jgi:hypothetical protein